MFTEQTYQFGKNDVWYELRIEVEQNRGNITYELQIYRLAEELDKPHFTSPGYLVEHHPDGYSVWVAEGFEDRYSEFSRWGRTALDRARKFLGGSPTPVNVVVATRDEKLHPRPSQSMGFHYSAYGEPV